MLRYFFGFPVAFLTAISVFENDVEAQEPNNPVKCVQQQLHHLDYKQHDANGILDDPTKASYDTIRTERKDINLPPVITNDNAIVICRQLGLTNFRLRFFWPSFRNQISYHFDDEISEKKQRIIRDASVVAINNMQNRLGIKLAENIRVFADDNATNLVEAVSKYQKIRLNETAFAEIHNRSCMEGDIVGGLASENNVAICIPIHEDQITPAIKGGIELAVFHEFVHSLQYQLVGGSLATWTSIPHWLFEGTADHLAISGLFFVDNIEPYYEALRDSYSGNITDIEKYEDNVVTKNDVAGFYLKSQLAVYFLAKRVGEKALVRFFEDIGNGLTWQESFEKNFQMTPAKFYEVYRQSQ